MGKQLERVNQVDRLLDKVMSLPPGHPDRLRYLTLAEQSLESRPPPVPQNRRRAAPPALPHAGQRAPKMNRSSA
jgi:hypothetical protein